MIDGLPFMALMLMMAVMGLGSGHRRAGTMHRAVVGHAAAVPMLGAPTDAQRAERGDRDVHRQRDRGDADQPTTYSAHERQSTSIIGHNRSHVKQGRRRPLCIARQDRLHALEATLRHASPVRFANARSRMKRARHAPHHLWGTSCPHIGGARGWHAPSSTPSGAVPRACPRPRRSTFKGEGWRGRWSTPRSHHVRRDLAA